MKIFFLAPTYPDKEVPTANIFVYEQAKQLAELGNEIIVLHVKRLPTSQILNHCSKKIMEYDDGFATRFCLMQKTFAESKYPLLNKKAFIKSSEKLYCHAVAKTGRPDVIYAHFSCWAGYAAGLISLKYDIPFVTLEHYSGFVKSSNIPKTLLKCVDKTIEMSQYFLCVSEGLKQAIENKVSVGKNVYVVPNMIDSSFKYIEPKKHDKFVFCAIGRLSPPKNYETLIESFIKAFSVNDDVILRIGGDGPERAKIEKLISDAGRKDQIILLGNLNRQQTVFEYANCDCFALSSAYETYGMVYREALAIGRPVITTDHGGFSGSDWHDEYGYKVAVRDVKSFSAAMVNMVRNYKSFNGQNISEICLRDCASEIVGEQIQRYLTRAVENRL